MSPDQEAIFRRLSEVQHAWFIARRLVAACDFLVAEATLTPAARAELDAVRIEADERAATLDVEMQVLAEQVSP